MVENQFQTKISIFCIDNGTEYFNTCLGDFLKKRTFNINPFVIVHINKMELLRERIVIYLKLEGP